MMVGHIKHRCPVCYSLSQQFYPIRYPTACRICKVHSPELGAQMKRGDRRWEHWLSWLGAVTIFVSRMSSPKAKGTWFSEVTLALWPLNTHLDAAELCWPDPMEGDLLPAATIRAPCHPTHAGNWTESSHWVSKWATEESVPSKKFS